jgi:uncharacterized protein (TIGR04222 family)
MNIFDLRGPAFLNLYVTLAATAFAVAAIMRWLLRGPGGELPRSELPTDPYDLAYLAGGPRGAVTAAAVALAHRKLIGFTRDRFHPSETFIGSTPPRDVHPLERTVFNVVASHETTTPPRLFQLARSRVAPSPSLIRSDLIVGDDRQWGVRLIPALGPVFVLIIGLIKIGVGLSRGKHVAVLVVLSIIVGVLTLVLIGLPAHRTRRGDRALREMRSRNAALRTTAAVKPQTLDPLDVAMACALFGPIVFAGATETMYRDLARKLGPANGSSDGGGFGHSCGGSSCGSSCGGGGGGCGGGCGGCGG